MTTATNAANEVSFNLKPVCLKLELTVYLSAVSTHFVGLFHCRIAFDFTDAKCLAVDPSLNDRARNPLPRRRPLQW